MIPVKALPAPVLTRPAPAPPALAVLDRVGFGLGPAVGLAAGPAAGLQLVGDRRIVDQPARWDAEEALTALYAAHYRQLVRLSALLLRDAAAAEEVVQDAFVAMHASWRRLRDPDKALAYLRQAVVNRSRSALRHRSVELKYAPLPMPDAPSAEYRALSALEHQEVVAALSRLPQRQREVLVLRYYADLSEVEIADAMGISRGAVKSHGSRGMAALRSALGQGA